MVIFYTSGCLPVPEVTEVPEKSRILLGGHGCHGKSRILVQESRIFFSYSLKNNVI